MNLFSPHLKRNELIKFAKELDFSKSQDLLINVHRNHAFEGVQSIIAPFLHFANLRAEFNFSSYDDSLSFDNFKEASLELLWLDLTRYKNNVQNFIEERLLELRKISQNPILVLSLGEFKTDKKILNCEIFNIEKLIKEYFDEDDILDLAKEELTGSKLNNKALIFLAQILGLSLIPALVKPALKALVLDLDNTLYQGILGEEGIDNLNLSPLHKTLQEKIKTFKKQGFLLALASKNEEKDAKKLFEIRKDFILQWDDFDTRMINWEPKGENILKIAKKFNINTNAMLFIDDNIAELENTKFTGVKTLLCDENILYKIKLFPNLLKLSNTKEDQIRAKDIAANALREELKSLSDEEYFQKQTGVKRTNDPIFSFAIKGAKEELFLKDTTSCFGENCVYEVLTKENGKYMTFGGQGHTLTHYAEEQFNVFYRYHKIFSGILIDENNISYNKTISYYVRKLDISSEPNLINIINIVNNTKNFKKNNFAGDHINIYNAKEYIEILWKKLDINQTILIENYDTIY
nr:HAD-IIIC family phosphatase [Campylobacter jejuni]